VDFWKTNAEVEFSPIIDGAAAVETGSLAAARQKSGRSVDMRDTQIAGISPLAIAVLSARDVAGNRNTYPSHKA
jgi:hypothetical protein